MYVKYIFNQNFYVEDHLRYFSVKEVLLNKNQFKFELMYIM